MTKATILIVDDELEIREMLSRNFRMKGFNVELAEHGQEALQILAKKRIDVVISDIMMPVLNGVDLLRSIRKQYPMIRVIMITGYVTLENALACMRVGAQTCIFKPFPDLDELNQEVEYALDGLKKWQNKLRELNGMKVTTGVVSK